MRRCIRPNLDLVHRCLVPCRRPESAMQVNPIALRKGSYFGIKIGEEHHNIIWMPVLQFYSPCWHMALNHAHKGILENHFVRVRHQLDWIQPVLRERRSTGKQPDCDTLEDRKEQLSAFQKLLLV